MQAIPQRQGIQQRPPTRSFLGRVSATSFLDSVGGMIPGSGSGPEAEQLPDGRVRVLRVWGLGFRAARVKLSGHALAAAVSIYLGLLPGLGSQL